MTQFTQGAEGKDTSEGSGAKTVTSNVASAGGDSPESEGSAIATTNTTTGAAQENVLGGAPSGEELSPGDGRAVGHRPWATAGQMA